MRRRTLAPGAIALAAAAGVSAGCTALLGIDGDYHASSGVDASDATTEGDVANVPETTAQDTSVPDEGGADASDGGLVEAGPVVKVSLGRFHSCARFAGGVAKCWGRNDDYGEFGAGGSPPSSSSNPVSAMGGGIVDLFAGAHDTCAVVAAGGECAGKGGAGELADGIADADSPVPVPTSALTKVPTAFASGERFTCAIVAGGDVYCVGDGLHGELGNGAFAISVAPVQVSLQGRKAQTIAALSQHACAALTDGTVACWGDDSAGQLGDGNATPDAGLALPVTVAGLPKGATFVGVGDSHSCAIVNGAVWCWGDNTFGQLGSGNKNPTTGPVQVLTGAGSLAVGAAHTCAGLINVGAVKCWGKDGSGQLGDNDTADKSSPVGVSGISAYPESLSAGGFHTCALVASPNVLCWGANDFGQLGNGDAPNQQVVPVQVKW